MSNYPGYPPPFSTWNSFTSTNRALFPLGSLPALGAPPGLLSLTDPAYLAARSPFLDPLSPFSVQSHLSSRYLPGLIDLPPVSRLEPLYGFGPSESRSLLHSPNLVFSQNPSPLTFDQVYRSSGASSVSPVTQYRNHFDQRYLGGHLGLTGRYSDPLCGQSPASVKLDLSVLSDKSVTDSVKQSETFELSDKAKKGNSDKTVKLWNPFISDEEKSNSSQHTVKSSDTDPCKETKSKVNVKKTADTEIDGDNLNSLNEKIQPPQYPVRPIPVLSSQISCFSFDKFPTPQLPNQLYPSLNTSSASVGQKCKEKPSEEFYQSAGDKIICVESQELSKNAEKDLNQNLDIVKNSNLIIEKRSNEKGKTEESLKQSFDSSHRVSSGVSTRAEDLKKVSEESANKGIIISCSEKVDDSCHTGQEKPENFNCTQLAGPVSGQDKRDFQSEFSDFLAKSVPYKPSAHINESASLPLTTVGVDSKNLEDNYSAKTNELISPKLSDCKTGGHFKLKSPTSKREELKLLSIQVNEVRNRRNSLSKESNTDGLVSPNTDKVLSPPLQPAPKAQDRCSRARQRRFTHPPIKQPARVHRHGVRMSTEGAITMMKSTDDSLSAVSSHLSESDSDTQMSTDHAEKLFRESQSLNTQSSFSSNQSLNQNYMPSMSVDQMTQDNHNQFFKTNTPQMCQSESDNQKPYPSVQDQSMFNEKPTVLPPFSCYSSNQSADVLPREPSFHSQEENSNFPPSLSVDSSNEYDENSVMSETTCPSLPQDCESQHGISHNSEQIMHKDPMMQEANHTMGSPEGFMHDPGEWDFLHSKQYIENIYGSQLGCEIVRDEEETLRESDSPKTFLDLDKTTKEKQAQEIQKGKSKEMSSKHYGKSYTKPGYAGNNRQGMNMYGNQSVENYGNGMGNRWNNFSARQGNQSRPGAENYGGHYNQNPNYPPNSYPHMNQSQNGQNVPSGYHGNEYNQNDYYNQNQSVKNYQGNFNNNPRYENNYYQNKGGNDYNTQGNMYPPNSGDMQGSARYGNQGYAGGQQGYGQHYSQAPTSHSGSDSMGQYPDNATFSIPRNASPASTGSDFSNMEAPGVVVVKKKRGRKRKVDKEPPDENKPRPNTIVMAPTKIGPLIDVDNPECTIDTYDYNNQIETVFNFSIEDDLSPVGAQFLQIEQRLCQKLLPIKYGYPVTVVYSPLTYAFQTHRDFVAKYCTSERTILFLGMNPGPYGMSQNGVPFGEVEFVKGWLNIKGKIFKPVVEHQKRPVHGLACNKNEVSGARFWGLFQKICKVPANFFKHCFVYNFCPLAYMSESGKNITPPQLVHSELDQINESCDTALIELVKLLNIRMIIAVGKFVQQRASKALHNAGIMNIKVECILHPSPINPHANKGWEQIVAKQLIEMNVMHYLNNDMEDVQRCIEEWERIAASNMKVPAVSKDDY